MLWLLLACDPGDPPGDSDSAIAAESPAVESRPLESAPPESTPPESTPDDSAADSGDSTPLDSQDSAHSDPPPGCLEEDGRVGRLSQAQADGARGTADGLGGSARLVQDASGTWGIVTLGASATTPLPEDTDGAVAVYAGMQPASAWLWCDPDEGELDALAVGELDGSAGDELAVVIEHPGLIGARVVVHEAGFSTRSALDAHAELVSEDQGAAATIAIGDMDGDGVAELITGWASQVERWSGPLPSGLLAEGDGDQQLDGHLRRWALIADVDADGYGDLVAASYEGPLAVLGGASGASASPASPDHEWPTEDSAGADLDGIAVGDVDGDGAAEVAIAVTAAAASDPAALVFTGLGETPIASPSGGETGTWQLAFADLDGDGGDELVLGRFQYDGASGGLLIWDSLSGDPMRISPQRGDGLLGAALGPGVDVDGDGREELPLVDPFGAADWDPRAYLLDPCEP
ncbi:MAG: hypothetical protein H6740_13970 [Alphaproteobacteria bacterium]|nr:hypothetical protein [Alphaproteobacteria bacterium]